MAKEIIDKILQEIIDKFLHQVEDRKRIILGIIIVYYESIKRKLKTRPIYECRCVERLKTKDQESTRLGYTGLFGKLEHFKIETRLIDEKFASVMGEYVFLKR
jgi:hypothetical protein